MQPRSFFSACRRRSLTPATLWISLALGSPVHALGAPPAFLADIMPPVACLAAPSPECLVAAVEAAVSRFERPETGRKAAALRLFMAVDAGLNEPAADALLIRYDPNLTTARLREIRAKPGWSVRPPVERQADPPAPSEFGAERALIVGISDPHARVWRANDIIGALIRSGRIDEAEVLQAATRKSLKKGDAGPRDYLAVTSARAFGAAGAWQAWSRSLSAAGFETKLATARTTSGPEEDPTEVAVAEPLRQGIPVEKLYPWIAHAKDRAFRESLMEMMVQAAFDRGRAASWRADFGGFRRYLVETTARGEMLRREADNPFSSADEALLTFARTEADARKDRGLALAAALQTNLKPPSEDTAVARDTARERILETLIRALPAPSVPR